MKNLFKKSLVLSLTSFFLFPLLTFAQSVEPKDIAPGGLVYECGGGAAGECSFYDLIGAVNKAINWGTVFALQFAVVVIVYAGFKYMQSGDNPGKRKEANEMLRKVVIGIFFILTAWVIVQLVMNGLGVSGGVPRFLQ